MVNIDSSIRGAVLALAQLQRPGSRDIVLNGDYSRCYTDHRIQTL